MKKSRVGVSLLAALALFGMTACRADGTSSTSSTSESTASSTSDESTSSSEESATSSEEVSSTDSSSEESTSSSSAEPVAQYEYLGFNNYSFNSNLTVSGLTVGTSYDEKSTVEISLTSMIAMSYYSYFRLNVNGTYYALS